MCLLKTISKDAIPDTETTKCINATLRCKVLNEEHKYVKHMIADLKQQTAANDDHSVPLI